MQQDLSRTTPWRDFIWACNSFREACPSTYICMPRRSKISLHERKGNFKGTARHNRGYCHFSLWRYISFISSIMPY
ncbi:hypothetical protein PVAP13_7NG295967 [Panicum virgatum]|uniref:Uncharacterized protein n=1 Tax=Panicum virgatum TaxID=38727 RepID=A0A8T0Q326_PANVG|nr:hypothetical protein PVAP13_7NG295967 [Panicum virgatum]